MDENHFEIPERNRDIEKWMKLFVGDFLVETQGMDTVEVGAYIKLCISYWTNGCHLPSTSEDLAKITGLSKRTFERKKRHIIANFTQKSGGLYHAKLAVLYEEQSKRQKAKKTSGAVGGKVNSKTAKRSSDGTFSPKQDLDDPSKRTPTGPGLGILSFVENVSIEDFTDEDGVIDHDGYEDALFHSGIGDCGNG